MASGDSPSKAVMGGGGGGGGGDIGNSVTSYLLININEVRP